MGVVEVVVQHGEVSVKVPVSPLLADAFPVGEHGRGDLLPGLVGFGGQHFPHHIGDGVVPELPPFGVECRVGNVFQGVKPGFVLEVFPAGVAVAIVVFRVFLVLHDLVIGLQRLGEDDIGQPHVVEVHACQSLFRGEVGHILPHKLPDLRIRRTHEFIIGNVGRLRIGTVSRPVDGIPFGVFFGVFGHVVGHGPHP